MRTNAALVRRLLAVSLWVTHCLPLCHADHYTNFKVAVCNPFNTVQTSGKAGNLESGWERLSSQLWLDRIDVEVQHDRGLTSNGLFVPSSAPTRETRGPGEHGP